MTSRALLLALGVVLGLFLPLAGQAQEAPSRERNVVTLVGTLTAVTPATRTVVVEVPLESHPITVGAAATPQTTFTAGGRPVAIEDLRLGSRVRITFRGVADGDELLSLAVLSAPG